MQVRTQFNIDSATKIVDELKYNDRERRKCNVGIYNVLEYKTLCRKGQCLLYQ